MNIIKIITKTLIILVLISIIFLPKIYAFSITNTMKSGDEFLESSGGSIKINKSELKDTSTSLYKTLLAIAICVSVIIGAILGFQFILGSVEGKAKVSEALVPYIIGCIVAFGAFTIWEIVISIGNNAGRQQVIVNAEPVNGTYTVEDPEYDTEYVIPAK